jgi:hypothetical protein
VALFAAGAAQSVLRLYVDLAIAEGVEISAARTWVGRDFTTLWLGAKLALGGVNIYDYGDYAAGLKSFGITQAQNYSYPPATLLIGTPFSLIPYPIALALWFAGGWVLFALAARPYIRFHPAWLLLLPAVVVSRNGQWGVFAAAMFLWSFRGSGVAAGLLTLKPHLGLVLAAVMLCKRAWRQIIVAVLVCALMWGAAELAFGLTWPFLSDGVAVQRIILTDPGNQSYFGAMPSTYVHLRGWEFAWVAHVAAASLAAAMLWQVRDRPMRGLVFPSATATFVVLPYAFGYDMAVVSLGFAIMIHERWRSLPGWQKVVAALGFLSPSLMWLGIEPIILLAGLYLQTRPSGADRDAVATGLPFHPVHAAQGTKASC